jgi:uncharacterized membrane protein
MTNEEIEEIKIVQKLSKYFWKPDELEEQIIKKLKSPKNSDPKILKEKVEKNKIFTEKTGGRRPKNNNNSKRSIFLSILLIIFELFIGSSLLIALIVFYFSGSYIKKGRKINENKKLVILGYILLFNHLL